MYLCNCECTGDATTQKQTTPEDATNPLHADDVTVTPRRSAERKKAADRLSSIGDKWKNKGRREGNTPIPVGGVVTVKTSAVDRGHTDDKRLIGVVVFVKDQEDDTFYRVCNKHFIYVD
jgi:predicted RNA-binding protein with TRAM domain